MPRRATRPGISRPSVRLIDRKTFIERVWTYKAGQHVSFIGPTESGKTTLMQPLLARSASENLPAYMTVMKPRDATVSDFLAAHKDTWRRSVTWPTPPVIGKKPVGWVVWPHHTRDPVGDDARHQALFVKMHRDLYVKGDCIIADDEAVSLVREMKMAPDLIRIWTKGRSNGAGMWAATQRPAMVPLEMYDQASHLFLAHDPDKRSQERFSEIGGVDPDLVVDVVKALPRFHWLYIRRSDRSMCVVGP